MRGTYCIVECVEPGNDIGHEGALVLAAVLPDQVHLTVLHLFSTLPCSAQNVGLRAGMILLMAVALHELIIQTIVWGLKALGYSRLFCLGRDLRRSISVVRGKLAL